MSIFTHGAVSIDVDEDGFMQEPDKWNEEVAKALATTEGVNEMTDEHWKLVNYLRNYFLQFGVAPMIRKLCKETGYDLKKVYALFPSGPAKGACKVAGYEGLCGQYYSDGGGHPTTEASIQLAKGFWWLIAKLGGWN